MLRGTRRGLELYFGDRPFEDSLKGLQDQISERPEFYRGASAVALFEHAPQAAEMGAVLQLLGGYGVTLRALGGPAPCAELARSVGLTYVGEVNRNDSLDLKRRKSVRRNEPVGLSEAARTLVADFEGARKDRAGRRFPAPLRAAPPSTVSVPVGTPTLYHNGTLRGGQALSYGGNVVVLGDVNPGAEVVASADIVIFGTLRGVAHAGAQGDAQARVFALDLAPTQLRIATWMAADFQPQKKGGRQAECAMIVDGRICVVPHERGRTGQREVLH